MTNLTAFWLTYAPVAVAALVALLGDMLGRGELARRTAVVLLAAAGVSAVVAGWTLDSEQVFGIFLTGSAYSTIPGVAMIVSAMALAAHPRSKLTGSTAALVALAVGGASIASASTDLTSMLIGLEIAALCGYAMVASARTSAAGEAAMKYFVQGAVATGLFVMGMAVLIGLFSADGRLSSIAAGMGASPGLSTAAGFGVVMLVGAVAFKAGAAPFHSWAPDAYETAPAASAGVMAGALKLTSIAVLTSIVVALGSAGVSMERPFGMLGHDLVSVMGALALLSIAIGSTVALSTRSYTRMLGYAGVAQVGYALVALAALNPSGALLFAATYALASTAAFASAEAFRRARPEWDGTIEGLGGMGRQAPLLSAAVTVALMSLAGVPPLLGFWGKLQAIAAAIGASTALGSRGSTVVSVWLGSLAAVAVIGSIVSLGYYGGVVRALYFGSHERGDAAVGESARESATGGGAGVVVALIGALLLLLGALPLIVGIPQSVAGFLLR